MPCVWEGCKNETSKKMYFRMVAGQGNHPPGSVVEVVKFHEDICPTHDAMLAAGAPPALNLTKQIGHYMATVKPDGTVP